MDGKIVATTKKSTPESLKCESGVDSFFYWKDIVHYEFLPCRSGSQYRVIPNRPEAFAGSSAKEEA